MSALLPGLVAFEQTVPYTAPVRQVTTKVEIQAPIQTIWDTVIAFPEIKVPPTGLFAIGIAYPIQARIDGCGVGAVRHCVFSTGSFVEPISAWEPPTLLAFDVAEVPPPLREISIYGAIETPHLAGHMVSKKGGISHYRSR